MTNVLLQTDIEEGSTYPNQMKMTVLVDSLIKELDEFQLRRQFCQALDYNRHISLNCPPLFVLENDVLNAFSHLKDDRDSVSINQLTG